MYYDKYEDQLDQLVQSSIDTFNEKNKSTGDVTVAGFVSCKDPTCVGEVRTRVCHAFMGHDFRGNSKHPYFLLNMLSSSYRQMNEKPWKNVERYYEWLLLRSPWAHVYINKTLPREWSDGIGCRLDVYGPLLGAAATAYRYPWENPNQVETWRLLVEEYGWDENLAFVFIHTYSALPGESCIKKMSPGNTNHTLFQHSVMRQEIETIVNNNLDTRKGELFTDTHNYRGIFKMFRGDLYNERDFIGPFVDRFLKANQPKGKVETVNYNIFKMYQERKLNRGAGNKMLVSFEQLPQLGRDLLKEVKNA